MGKKTRNTANKQPFKDAKVMHETLQQLGLTINVLEKTYLNQINLNDGPAVSASLRFNRVMFDSQLSDALKSPAYRSAYPEVVSANPSHPSLKGADQSADSIQPETVGPVGADAHTPSADQSPDEAVATAATGPSADQSAADSTVTGQDGLLTGSNQAAPAVEGQ